MSSGIVFVHSPLLDGQVWTAVAERIGLPSVVADIRTEADEDAPGQRHIEVITGAARALGTDTLHLVAHSGGGVLIAPVVDSLGPTVATTVYVDAMLPRPGASRFDLIAWESNDDAPARLRQHLDAGGLFPHWGDRTWAGLVDDEALRARLRPTLRPLGTDYWDEVFHASARWETVPSLYVRCTDTYRAYEVLASDLGWTTECYKSGHLAPATSPGPVAAILDRWLTAAPT